MTKARTYWHRRILSGAVAAIALFSIVFASTQAGPTISLYDAIRDGKVQVTIRGTGGSTGPSVLVDASKGPSAGPGDIHVTVPPGTILRNRNTGGQNMVVAAVLGHFMGTVGSEMSIRPTTEMVVSDVAPMTYVLAAYCVQFEKDNPSTSDQFTLAPPDPALAAILNQGTSLSESAIQAAVWMQTDHVTLAHMNAKFPISQADWAAAQVVFQRALQRAPAATSPALDSQAAGLAGSAAPRFDGLYASGDGLFLRFFPDGFAIFCASTGTAREVAQWFDRASPDVSRGHFVVRGSEIQVSIEMPSPPNPTGTILHYEGTISGDSLMMAAKNGQLQPMIYRFAAAIQPKTTRSQTPSLPSVPSDPDPNSLATFGVMKITALTVVTKAASNAVVNAEISVGMVGYPLRLDGTIGPLDHSFIPIAGTFVSDISLPVGFKSVERFISWGELKELTILAWDVRMADGSYRTRATIAPAAGPPAPVFIRWPHFGSEGKPHKMADELKIVGQLNLNGDLRAVEISGSQIQRLVFAVVR